MSEFSFEYGYNQSYQRVQSFGYNQITSTEYLFLYSRHILSDLAKFNAPIFISQESVGAFLNANIPFDKIPKDYMDYDQSLIIEKIKKPTDESYIISVDPLHQIDYGNIEDIIALLRKVNGPEMYFHGYWFSNSEREGFANRNNFVAKDGAKAGWFNDIKSAEAFAGAATLIKEMLSNRKEFSVSVTKDSFAQKVKSIINIDDILKLKNVHDKKNSNIYSYLFGRKDINYAFYRPENITGYRPIRQLYIYENRSASYLNNRTAILNKTIGMDQLQQYKNINIYRTLVLHRILWSELTQTKPYISGDLLQQYASYASDNWHSGEKMKWRNTYKFNDYRSWSKELYESGLGSQTFVSKAIEDGFLFRQDNLLYKDIARGFVDYNNILPTKTRLSILRDDTDETLFKDSQGFVITKGNLLNKSKLGLQNLIEITELLKTRKGLFNKLRLDVSAERKRYGFHVDDNYYHIDPIRKNFFVLDFNEFLERNILNLKDISRIKGNLYQNTIAIIIPMKVPHRSVSIINKAIFAGKSAMNSSYDRINEIIEKMKSTSFGFSTNVWSIKEEQKTFLQYCGVILKKQYVNAILESNRTFIRSLPKEAYLPEGYLIYKNKKEGLCNNSDTLVSILNKELLTDNSIAWVDKDAKIVFKNTSDKSIIKSGSDLSFYGDEIFTGKDIKEAYVISYDKWISEVVAKKLSKHTMYDTGNTNVDKTNGNEFSYDTGFQRFDLIYNVLAYNNDIVVDIDKRYKMSIDDKGVVIDNDSSRREMSIREDGLWYEQVSHGMNNPLQEKNLLFTRESVEFSIIATQVSAMEDTLRKLESPDPKVFNWAWVYQYEDPIKPNKDFYGIDELLLPRQDVNYQDFVDTIFDSKRLMPKAPVKIIDDTTFIAKYPIKHPIPKYEDVGIDYIDVPSELMREIFLKFYQIWYNNVFKFGTMSMVASVNLMMDYMYSYIVMTFAGSEYLEEALRVLRLIRWFAESSVMNNSQYKISYTFEDAKSNLQTGICQIDNTMEFMKVNKNLAVIEVDSSSFRSVNEPYVTFYINNKRDTEITFSISFTGGYVEIYLNNELIDTIAENKAYIKYEIPRTGQQNEFKIKRPAVTNVGFCYIGNIIVKNAKFKDLDIQFDNDNLTGNLPLNDIVQKMILLANMYEDEAAMFEQFKKGNVGVSELYNSLQKYWEHHHQDKYKGKRLTIKET